MPSITHTLRASIGGSQEATPTRATLTVPTGMNAPSIRDGGNTVPSPAQTGQPVTTEGTTAAVTLSPQLTALARKQQKLQSEIQAQREKEAQWEKDKAGYVSKDAIKAKAQQNAAEALADLGFTYDEITNLLLDQQNGQDPVQQLKSEIDSLKKSQEESTVKLFEQTVAQYRTEASKIIASDEKYVMLKDEPEAAKAAIDELLEDFDKTGETKDISYYLDLAEDGLKEMATSLASRLEKTKKPEQEVTAPAKKQLPPPAQAQRTLTQQVATTPTRVPNQFQHLSPKDRIAQAIARAQR